MIPIRDYPGVRRSFPWVMLIILALNVGVFAFELSLGSDQQLERLFAAAGVVPVEYTRGAEVPPPPPLGITWTTLITSMFLHGGFLHISSNMLYLFVFGDNVEDRLGHLRFLIFYFICGIAAGLTHIFFNAGSSVPSVGASGAIAGVLAAYLRLFPSAQVRTLLILGPFITIPRIPAGFLILFWFVMQFLSGLLSLGATTEQTGGVATWAHVGGFVAGFILAQIMTPRRQPAYPSSSW
jgi:membrane associated rhomboid family serine protease